jgi:hypothetical protein
MRNTRTGTPIRHVAEFLDHFGVAEITRGRPEFNSWPNNVYGFSDRRAERGRQADEIAKRSI